MIVHLRVFGAAFRTDRDLLQFPTVDSAFTAITCVGYRNLLRWINSFEIVADYTSEEISRMHPDFLGGGNKERSVKRFYKRSTQNIGTASAETDLAFESGRKSHHVECFRVPTESGSFYRKRWRYYSEKNTYFQGRRARMSTMYFGFSGGK